MSKNKRSRNANLHLYRNPLPIEFINTSKSDFNYTLINNIKEGISPLFFCSLLFRSAKEYFKLFFHKAPSPVIIDLTFEEIFENKYLIIASKDFSQRDLLWYGGYFGTGNLSRSQPTWFLRKKRDLDENQKRRFPEDLTAQRRLKKQIIKEQQVEYEKTFKKFVSNEQEIDQKEIVKRYESLKALKKDRSSIVFASTSKADEDVEELQDQEEYVLTLEEYLYLKLFVARNSMYLKYVKNRLMLKPDMPLNKLIHEDSLKKTLVRFVVYSALRNKGYIVREGVKFGADYLVYDKKGPVFQHSDYSIVIRDFTGEDKDIMSAEDILSRLRIIGTANKKMITMDVECNLDEVQWEKIKEQWKTLQDNKSLDNLFLSLLSKFSIDQLLIERWIPERSR
ncbi:uncharacterized protein HGUI_02438 [Hanseniaspora guilliermondii]|uniref:tRNA-splicing endonuclease subunit Sen2 n=1 Tax=Hanseniaspora guilliermondii TaxID=56406 RepID=A0A1L0FKZ6_9ASCO|nr:uncharacterized protein HGUI_02438 [Hanseniaspora guilliermondii]